MDVLGGHQCQVQEAQVDLGGHGVLADPHQDHPGKIQRSNIIILNK